MRRDHGFVTRSRRLEVWVGVFATDLALGEYDVRGVLFVGNTRAAVWDTLSHPRDMAGWRPLIDDPECLRRFTADAPKTLRERQRAKPGAWDEVTLTDFYRKTHEANQVSRALTDAELDGAAPVSLSSDAPLTCQVFLEDHAVRHSYHHLARIRAALAQ